MAETHLVGALRKKRGEIFGRIIGLEKELRQRRVDLKHVDATLRLFALGQSPSKRPGGPFPLRRGECSRLVLDALRRATPPLTTREITERLLAGKRTGATNSGDQDALHKTVLAALKVGRNKGLIERTGSGRGVAASWRIAR
jgi:hypothetical protein